jgi:hypothetical protein
MNATARYVVAGAVLALLISAAVFVLWPVLYNDHRWPGYERAAAHHAGPWEYNASPTARRHVIIAFMIAGVLAGVSSRGGAPSVVALWLGLSIGLLLSFGLRPAAWTSNLAPLALILYPIQALPFLIMGMVGAGVRRIAWSRAG